MPSVSYGQPHHKRFKLDPVRILSYLAMATVVILIMVPIFWMLSGSLKTNQEIMKFPPQWLPTNPQWHNYREA